ncbi:MAG: hypothetical protein IT452_05755 [Planctomycetia bacterium]|nr:hypothetical protein [Planctomycetia bacterium]
MNDIAMTQGAAGGHAGCVNCAQDASFNSRTTSSQLAPSFRQPSSLIGLAIPEQMPSVTPRSNDAGFLLGQGSLHFEGGPVSQGVLDICSRSLSQSGIINVSAPLAAPFWPLLLGDWPCQPAHIMAVIERLGSVDPAARAAAREELLDLLELCPDLVSQLGERVIADKGNPTTGEPGEDPEIRAALEEILDVLQISDEELAELRKLIRDLAYTDDFTKADVIAAKIKALDAAIPMANHCRQSLIDLKEATQDRQGGFMDAATYTRVAGKLWRDFRDCVEAKKRARAARRKRLGLR